MHTHTHILTHTHPTHPTPAYTHAHYTHVQAAPSLPLGGVLGFLRELLGGGGKWATLALSTAWDAIEGRPPARAAMLDLVLEAAEGEPEGREGAGRGPAGGCCGGMLWRGAVAGWFAVYRAPGVDSSLVLLLAPNAHIPTDPHEEVRSAAVRLLTSKLYPRPNLRPTILTTAALRLTSLMPAPPPAPAPAPAPADTTTTTETATTTTAEAGAGEAGAEGTAAAAEPPQPPLPPPPPVEPCSVSEATRRVALYMALVAKQPDLLPGLVAAYAGGGPNLRAAVGGHAGSLAAALGPSHPALLAQLRAPVPGSEELLLTMLHVRVCFGRRGKGRGEGREAGYGVAVRRARAGREGGAKGWEGRADA